MFDNEKSLFSVPKEAVDLAKEVYEDAGQQAISEVGKIIARIPRAINAAFSGVDIWITKKEYNIEVVKKSLADKLKNVDPEKIVEPEPYVAIPALQAISYSKSSAELYNLYSNLLAKAAYSDTKNMVHPSFVDLIRNMSPLDAKILKHLSVTPYWGIVDLADSAAKDEDIKFFSGYDPLERNILGCNFASHLLQSTAVDNLKKLGLIDISTSITEIISDASVYQSILLSDEYKNLLKLHPSKEHLFGYRKTLKITDYGKLFIDVCINESFPE